MQIFNDKQLPFDIYQLVLLASPKCRITPSGVLMDLDLNDSYNSRRLLKSFLIDGLDPNHYVEAHQLNCATSPLSLHRREVSHHKVAKVE